MPTHDRLFARIDQLFDVGAMSQAKVFVAGCGSGGGAVALQLVMSGIRNFTLADNDTVDIENVIRHVCGLRYLGQRKVLAVKDVLQDRNPAIQVEAIDVDLETYAELDREIAQADVVVMATDNDPTRYRINQACVRLGKPFVVARVFTRGIGGEVFAYRPGQGGCLACLEKILERTQFRDGVREIDLVSEEERDKIYGGEVEEIKDSPGLNIDISFVTAFHTRFVLDAIAAGLPERPKFLFPIDENYVVWGNRPVHPFNKNFQLQRIAIKPQDGCLVCGGPK